MNFQRGQGREEPEINLIPMIDVLLVILIFLMVTTSYAQYAELQVNLPEAGAPPGDKETAPIVIAVDASEHYAIDDHPLAFSQVAELTAAMKQAAGNQTDPVIVINADARAPHQAVVNIMEAARQAGYGRITFATRTPGR